MTARNKRSCFLLGITMCVIACLVVILWLIARSSAPVVRESQPALGRDEAVSTNAAVYCSRHRSFDHSGC